LSKRLKLLGALMLLGSIALPMARGCARVDAQGRLVRPYEYAFDRYEDSDERLIVLVIFAWPMIALGILAWRQKGYVSFGVRAAEPFLMVLSFLAINFISTFFTGGRAFGAYVAFAGLGFYAVGALWSDVIVFRKWRSRRTALSES
jgi:hypothetical protein